MKKFKFITLFLICLIFLTGISAISGHGVDLSDNVMVMANETNGVMAKKLIDEMGLNITVYKFSNEHDATHVLDHALTNPNKRILSIAYQDGVNGFLKEHPNMTEKVMVVSGNTESEIKDGLIKFNASLNPTNEDNMAVDYVSLILIIVVVGLVAGIGVFLLKKK